MSSNTDLTLVSSTKVFGGQQRVYSHWSHETKCIMNFALYLPPSAVAKTDASIPVLYWLSGLTCTEQNFIQKSGAQRYATECGISIVCPDTSPRGCNIEGEDESWDFGTGAGFYVDATTENYSKHYRMYSYVTRELPMVLEANFPSLSKTSRAISGHSMGGHGALICALKNPGMYRSVSAFAPICNPINCAWGQRALTGYLGDNKDTWKNYDATALISVYNGPELDILIDQGGNDNFLHDGQLLPMNLIQAKGTNVKINYRNQEGYDHSYFFIATFIGEHIQKHSAKLLS